MHLTVVRNLTCLDRINPPAAASVTDSDHSQTPGMLLALPAPEEDLNEEIEFERAEEKEKVSA